ncbi:MAG: acetyl-CoA C-acetyltransferase [Phycisphaerales bacterium]|jgi:acetyl-CoA C-acetyltransferase|nr:acetyl-CoA C-acetyltransferase [Phycisphaerales bacterium]
MTNIVIVAAKRTPQGRFLGSLAKRSAVDLAVHASRATMQSASIQPEWIDQVILGNVLSAGLGMNIARQTAVKLQLPITVPAFVVNMMCASGLQAVHLAAQAIRAGDARCILCGGSESMSNAPYLLDRARNGYKLGDGLLIDTILRDGLTDPFGHGHMGNTAENLADRYDITRQQQDAFSARSQQRYGQAHTAGRFTDEIAPLDDLSADEHPRPDTTEQKLSTLKPAFNPQGTVTAGNASGINDGAAMLILCDGNFAKEHNLKPMAELLGESAIGCDPALMGLGPVHATNALCKKLKISPADFDTIELNEAFAAQALACIRELKLDESRVNSDGGAIALGHPIGASGARLIVHLAHSIASGRAQSSLATLCVGAGMGIAAALRPAK